LAPHVLPPPNRRPFREFLSASGMALIFFAIFYFTSETNFPSYKALFPTLGAALIIYAGTGGKSLIVTTLSSKPIVFIGLISYSLYLWHWPIIVFTKYYFITELSFEIKLSMLIAIFILSWIIYRNTF
ncbi:MAG: acyltransferase family protein, partial [Colwellia sp.]